MSRKPRYAITALIVLILGSVLVFYILKNNTKSYSPEEFITYRHESLKINVFYNRPYKKDRVIFGELVPFGEVWRTGANEATTFEVNQDVLIDGSLLEAGKYTLWTIPNEKSWKVIFNKKMYAWGIDLNTQKAARDEAFDALVLELPVMNSLSVTEQFTIHFDRKNDLHQMFLSWDKTLIAIPIKTAH